MRSCCATVRSRSRCVAASSSRALLVAWALYILSIPSAAILAVVGLVVSVTLMLTWHGGGLTGALVVEGVYLATALWLVVRFAPRDGGGD